MGSPSLDLYAVPPRRRAPRVAILLLPLTLGLVLLYQVARCASRAVGATIRLCCSKPGVFYWCLWGLFFAYTFVPDAAHRELANGLITAEFSVGTWVHQHWLPHNERAAQFLVSWSDQLHPVQLALASGTFPRGALYFLLPLILWPVVVAFLYAFIGITRRRFASVW